LTVAAVVVAEDEPPHILDVLTPEMITIQRSVMRSELEPKIDRRAHLYRLVTRVTAKGQSTEERAVLWTTWLQNYFAHPRWAPKDNKGTAIFDPMWLLKHRIAHCGQVNRLLVDGLSAIGTKARLIQLNGHVAAEVYYDESWHFLDADVPGFGQVIRNNGRIPSAVEIANDISLADQIDVAAEWGRYPVPLPDGMIPKSYAKYFKPWRNPINGLTTPYTMEKTASTEQEQNALYGWDYWKDVPLGR
jgi:Transglutaminase-like superfamily